MVFERYAFNRVHRTRTGEYKNTKNKTVGLQSLAICKLATRQ